MGQRVLQVLIVNIHQILNITKKKSNPNLKTNNMNAKFYQISNGLGQIRSQSGFNKVFSWIETNKSAYNEVLPPPKNK